MLYPSRILALLRLPIAAAAVAALVLVGLAPQAVADPVGALDADQLELGDHTEDIAAGDFTVRATDSDEVTVSEHSRTTEEGHDFAQRLELKGSGDAESRSVQFEAEAGQQVTVHAQSGSSDEDRTLGLYDGDWTELDRVPAYRGDSGSVLPAQSFTIEEAGTYWIASPSSGVNIYRIELGEAGEAPERIPWDEVPAPVIEDISVSQEDPGSLEVIFSGIVGAAGGDVARAFLLDETGSAVDEQISVSPGEGGVIALTPSASGDYTVEVQLERHSEDVPVGSDPVPHTGFVLPLDAPEVISALTSDVDGEDAVAAVQWAAVPEAENYTVSTRIPGEDFETAVEGVDGTEADVSGLRVGEDYEVQVTALRDEDSATSQPYTFTVAGEVERWDTAHAGVGSGGEVIEHEDGSLEFDLLDSGAKIADSEDGFWYHYTEIDPQTENFTLDATFEVDDDSRKDNQSGFGVIAVDDFVPGDTSARYFNSAGAMTAKYAFGVDGEEGNRYGTPGGRFVHGYTDGPTTASAERDMTDSRAFDWDYKSDYTVGSNTNPPRFEAGETYEFSLRRSNTGFHAIWHRDGQVEEVIHYHPDLLLTQNGDRFYVGLFAARGIAVTVTDWSFQTLHPDEDEEPEEEPTRYVTPRLSSDVTSTTSQDRIDVPLVSSVHGEAVLLDEEGAPLTEPRTMEPGTQELFALEGLDPGENTVTARLDPAEEQPQLDDNEELESTDPVEIELTFTVHSYGEPGQALRVSPEGTAEGEGTEEDPLDLHTAVAYVQPGQQIVLEGGIYALEEAVRIDRGNSGTEEQPITLMSEPGARAVLELENSDGGGIILRGDWWHLHDLEIRHSASGQKPLHIQGHHNVIERIETHHNHEVGLQISGSATEPPEMWPSYNTVVSSVSHNNADTENTGADGFAAKLTVGEGNVFRWTISHHNIDDGFDLYAKSTEGPIGTVLIEESVAYSNGRLEDDPEATVGADGQGFKLGGESQPGDHLLRNSISYDNVGNGITSNSGPDPRLQEVTTVFNGLIRQDREGAGVSLYTNNAPATDFRASGVLSYANSDRDRIEFVEQEADLLSDPTNYFNGRSTAAGAGVDAAEQLTEVTEDWFVSTDHEAIRPEIATDGSIEMHGLFELTDAAPAETGARLNTNPDPTELELFPTVTPGQDDDGEEDSDDDAGGGDPADDDTSGDGPADDDAPGGGPADDDAPGSGPADDGPSDGEATGKDSSHGDPADDDSAPGADTGDGADRTGATGDEATGHSGGLATTGTEAALLALLVLALLGVGVVLVRRSKGGPSRLK